MLNSRTENSVFIFEQPIKYSWKYFLKRGLLPFLDIFYFFILKTKSPKPTSKKFKVVICAIFKNEAVYLKEWIEYHKIVGVEHFYLYNNFSEDNYKEILRPYITNKVVTLVEWPVLQGQFSAYQHFYGNFRTEAQWVSFLDIDEFICPINETSICEWVDKFKNYPCVIMYWKMFGTSGQIYHDPVKLVVEQYTVSWNKLYSIGKVFLNTNFEIAFFDFTVHHSTYTKFRFLGTEIIIPPINEFKYFVHWNIHRKGNRTLDNFTIQVNHYWSKALNVYEYKTKGSDVAYKVNPKNWDYFLAHEKNNKSVDYKIYRFVISLKKVLGYTKDFV